MTVSGHWLVLVRLPFLLLQDRCAAASGLVGSPGLMWSAVHGSSGFAPSPHRWQVAALALTCWAMRL